jgi:glycosyltransferase involved in cell wall biosynthesis
MAFARPGVATAAGGIPDAVVPGETGLLVPVADHQALAQALLELLGDPARREAMGAQGRRRFLAEFTDDRMVEATLSVCAELVS